MVGFRAGRVAAIAFIVVFGLSAMDGLITWASVSKGAYETDPFSRLIMRLVGLNGWVAFELTASLIFLVPAFLAWRVLDTQNGPLANASKYGVVFIGAILILLYVFAVVHELSQL